MKNTQRKQFLYNTEWYHTTILSAEYDELRHEHGIKNQNGEFNMVHLSLLSLIVQFQEKFILHEEWDIEVIEMSSMKRLITPEMTWPCSDEGPLRNMVITLFIYKILPDIIENEKNYRKKKIKTLQQQLNKLQK